MKFVTKSYSPNILSIYYNVAIQISLSLSLSLSLKKLYLKIVPEL